MAATALLLPPTIPPEYHRIISPALRVSTDPRVPVPVGLLACQRDPLLREIETTVVNCVVSQPVLPQAGKKTKKAVLAPTLPDDPMLEVVLHDTVIFPEGGGQPTDTGIISTLDGAVWSVIQSKRHGGHAVHYVRVPNGSLDAALIVFSPGNKVTAALDRAGYDRRYDHMSMHTSQHLLSALLESYLNLPTLSWSLTSYPAPCYVEVPRGMTAEEIQSIQDEANRQVFEGRNVHIEVEELELGKETKVPKIESGRAVGRGLPDDYTGGVKRIVVIEGVDRNPCCGTHLPGINNLQLFLLPHTDALARSSTTSARLYFLSGPRLIIYLSSTHTLLASAASSLSCGAPLVPERVNQVVDERKRAEKRVQDVENEVAAFLSRDLYQELCSTEDEVFRKHIHRTDDSGNALGFLSMISATFLDALKETLAVKRSVIIFSSSPSSQTSSSTTVVMIIGSDDKLVKEVGDILKVKLGVKGGGKGLKWSGKFTGVWKDRDNAAMEDVLASI
ncbi:ThrRS/AlaRS common domain-containing protein [Guyanagaster necrorhizus]|uniref:ThrRS/AlaRS common domain-containing protein n=1 Tax=Guyanagaster necrorhizus TaxID=856835 RepID=A0A9P8AVP4_9AGAR|nr:ThrRS/AlaRS common domain-containing protein [Guyanagaster necrorhizus MCA 3950]KAG7449316.1 ThrRS/AlaRS common domain-containing protein [Guyanagaster necrorhizus MCA 3950]